MSSTTFGKVLAEGVDVFGKAGRHVLMHAAGAEIIGVQARSRDALVEDHELFALFEAPERRRQRADIERVRGDLQQMVHQPPDLAEQHTDILGAAGHLDSEQLFLDKRESMFLVERRDVIEAIEIGHRLHIGLVLDQLLGAAMEQPDMRIDAGDDFAVELHHQPQHAVCGRMLRTPIQRHASVVEGFAHQRFSFFAMARPGRLAHAPSHGLMKSKSRNS